MKIQLIETAKKEFVKSLGNETADSEWNTVAQELYDLKMVVKKYTLMESELKKKLTALSNEQTTFNSMYMWERSDRVGTLDYAKIIKDYNVEKDLYRKASTAVWKLSKL